MRNNKLRPNYIIPAAIFLMLLVYVIFIREGDLDEILTPAEDVTTVIETSPYDNKTAPKPAEGPKKQADKPGHVPKPFLSSVGFDKSKYNHFRAQEELKKKFKDTVKLEIDLPANMNYIQLDIEDEVAGLYGSNLESKQEFAMLATARKVSVEEAMAYLKESTGALPMLKSHDFQPEKTISVKAPASTGLESLKIIPSTDANGQSAFAAMAERKDGKGTYLFLMEAPKPYFDQNEEGLEMMLKSIKTQQ